jgi:glutamate receptor, ionotropic, invertebrate
MDPLSKGVWACLAGAILIVSFSFFILGRMSPKEWDNPYPCIQEPTVLQNQYTFKNSMWFTIGAILQEGSDVAPKAVSTRIVASIWWFFTLIMVSSYTANLASFLTISKTFSSINNIDDVYFQQKAGILKYGAKGKGSTIQFFEKSENETFKEMYNYMKKNAKDVLMANNDLGVEKIENENYAFFMESSTIEYITQRNCKVIAVGEKLDQKSYGIAMKKRNIYVNLIQIYTFT